MSVKEIALRHLQRVKPAGEDHLQARCPFHDTKSGSPFSINTHTGMWICFSCGASGSFPSFLKRFGYTPDQVSAYVASARLDDTVSDILRSLGLGRKKWSVLPEYVLGAYVGCPVSLLEAGFTMQTLFDAEVGYDRLEDRVTFPIRDYLGRLVAVSGRAQEKWREPRYKVYEEPFKALFDDGEYEPKAKLHVYGLHSIYAKRFYSRGPQPPLVIVEGYKGCLWLRQNGFPDTVAVMGSMASQMQAWLISRLPGPYCILLDHEPGKNYPDDKRRCAAYAIARRLEKAGTVRIGAYPEDSKEGTSPDDLTDAQAAAAISGALTLAEREVVKTTGSPWRRLIK